MKYMTKKWYETMQRSDLHVLLEVSEEAQTYSDTYFDNLYVSKEQDWLQLQEEVSNVTLNELYPEEFSPELPEGFVLSEEQFEVMKSEYFAEREKFREMIDQAPPFDAQQEKIKFRDALDNNIAMLKNDLPAPILDDVADIRVLGLNLATAEVVEKIRRFSETNQQFVDDAVAKYEDDLKKDFDGNLPEFMDDFGFHDCIVTAVESADDDLILMLDNSGGFTEINQIILKKGEILKQDESLINAWWLYEEIYKKDTGYEIHVLLQKDYLIDFVVKTADVQYGYNNNETQPDQQCND